MEYFSIVGNKPLNGRIKINGAKNAALPILAAALLVRGKTRINNVPILKDTITMFRLLESLGATIKISGHSITVDASEIKYFTANYDLVKTMRASIYVMAPLLARYGKCDVAFPGGCSLGVRPIDIHLKGFEKMNVTFHINKGNVIGNTNKLNGAEINLDFPSVGATANLLIAAVLAHGETIISNYAKEPEIFDLINFLIKLGSKIDYDSDALRVVGVNSLKENVSYSIIPDRIELGTFGIIAIATKGNVELEWNSEDFIVPVRKKLNELGANVFLSSDGIYHFEYKKLNGNINIKTLPYPGFPTDLQPPMGALLTINEGTSVIDETIFENRFMWVPELERMGAEIKKDGNTIIIHGKKKLLPAPIMVSDIRAGAALLVGALATEGKTRINRIYHIDRGYEKIEERLKKLGADIIRLNE